MSRRAAPAREAGDQCFIAVKYEKISDSLQIFHVNNVHIPLPFCRMRGGKYQVARINRLEWGIVNKGADTLPVSGNYFVMFHHLEIAVSLANAPEQICDADVVECEAGRWAADDPKYQFWISDGGYICTRPELLFSIGMSACGESLVYQGFARVWYTPVIISEYDYLRMNGQQE
jgi:hypothetical protein